MRNIETKLIKISKLRLPGDWRSLLAEPSTEEYAASLLASQPVVRASDHRLLSGKIDVAARERLGMDEALVRMVDCTDAEAQAIEAADAGSNRNEITLMLVNQLTDEAGGRGAARRAIAETQGIRPESVRMREYRANKSKPKAPEFNDLGMTLDPEWLEKVVGVQEQLDGVIAKVALAKGALTRMVKQGEPLPQRVAHLQEEMGRLGVALKGMRPHGVCPYCKTIQFVRAECAGCETLGYLSEQSFAGVPPEFLAMEAPVLLFRGETSSALEFTAIDAGEAVGLPEAISDAPGVGDDPSEVWPL